MVITTLTTIDLPFDGDPRLSDAFGAVSKRVRQFFCRNVLYATQKGIFMLPRHDPDDSHKNLRRPDSLSAGHVI
jgi:hypothetical protein